MGISCAGRRLRATPSILLVIGGFAVLFFAAGLFLARRLGDRMSGGAGRTRGLFGDARGQIPAFSALLPFMLLVMMTQRLPLANPSPDLRPGAAARRS